MAAVRDSAASKPREHTADPPPATAPSNCVSCVAAPVEGLFFFRHAGASVGLPVCTMCSLWCQAHCMERC